MAKKRPLPQVTYTPKVKTQFRWDLDPAFGFSYTSGRPCESLQAKCPMQLVFINGRTFLRLCRQAGQPGYLVPVEDPSDAAVKASEACGCWEEEERRLSWWDFCQMSRGAINEVEMALMAAREDLGLLRARMGSGQRVNPSTRKAAAERVARLERALQDLAYADSLQREAL